MMLTDETIRQHLEGKITTGLYAINPSTQRCKWLAIDADYKNSIEDLLKLQYHLTQDRVEPALEMSRRRWASLDLPGNAFVGQRMPSLYPRSGHEAGRSGERRGSCRRHRGVSQARHHRRGRVRQRHPGSSGNPPWRQSPILVLWR